MTHASAEPGEARSSRILVIDDEEDVTSLLAYHLTAKGFQVQVVNDASTAMENIRTFHPDLVILDVMMPVMDGIQVCRTMRADPAAQHVPIIFLSAKSEETDRIRGLEVGGDDYICKPFSTKELLLRVRAVLKRHAPREKPESSELRAGRVVLNTELHSVAVAGQPLELTATEFKLLQTLMARKGRVQTRDHLLLNVWNYETEIETRTIDTHVRRLREKLGSEAPLIETVRGVGYRMVDRRPEPCSP